MIILKPPKRDFRESLKYADNTIVRDKRQARETEFISNGFSTDRELYASVDVTMPDCVEPSRYNILKRYGEGALCLNFISGAAVYLNCREIKTLEGEVYDRDIVKSLFISGLIKDRAVNERDALIAPSDYVESGKINDFTVLPTQNCNAKCAYCFSLRQKRYDMTLESAKEAVKFINENGQDEIFIRWFGGEPLMAQNIIDYISGRIEKKFYSQIFTNGSLITDELLDKAKTDWKVRKIHVTVDGYLKSHAERKVYPTVTDEYYCKLLESIGSALEKGFKVSCRINLDLNNIDQLDKILDDLEDFRKYVPAFYAYGVPLHDYFNTNDEGKIFIHKEQYETLYKRFYRTFIERKLYKNMVQVFPRSQFDKCLANKSDSVIIGADGNLFKCLNLDKDNPSDAIGSCREGINNSELVRRWESRDALLPECLDCAILPLCRGGCKLARLYPERNLNICPKEKYYTEAYMDLLYENCLQGELK